MQTELEIKILDINIEQTIQKLEALGAKKISEKMQRRLVYDLIPKTENSWIRLRTDGEKTTLTIKEIHHDRIDGTKELEVIVEDFDKTNLILRKLGFHAKAYQENKRARYQLNKTEIDIDLWPKIPPYMEIEAESRAEIEETIRALGYTLSDTTSISTKNVYKKYGIDIEPMAELKF